VARLDERATVSHPFAELEEVSSCRNQAYQAKRNQQGLSRKTFLHSIFFTAHITAAAPALSFEGGIGGLGKTKPETGVVFLSDPLAINGLVNGELMMPDGLPLLVSFQVPKNWPLLAGSGLEARDIETADSAFLQVVENVKVPPTSSEQIKALLLESLLSMKGKFGAYGSPTDIKVKSLEKSGLYSVSFTTLTPGQRESDRKIFLQAVSFGRSILLFVVGGTRQRFTRQEPVFRQIVDSFVATPAPATKLSTVYK
jgi:hypothetical protein